MLTRTNRPTPVAPADTSGTSPARAAWRSQQAAGVQVMRSRRPAPTQGPEREEGEVTNIRATRTRGPAPGDTERGSVLMLFPAAVLVVLVLAAITIDSGLVLIRVQELRHVAASAANDAAAAVDVDALRSTGDISFDQQRAHALAEASLASGALPQANLESLTITQRSANRWQIQVTVSARIDLVLAPALPGEHRFVNATVTEAVLVVT